MHGDFEYPWEKMQEQRFWLKVIAAGALDCWIWNGTMHRKGYGQFDGIDRTVKAHRFSYEAMIGEIPQGLVLDHLCRVRSCVNPYHLEPVTSGVNTRRGLGNSTRPLKTHCPQGHEYVEGNIYLEVAKDGGNVRHCRTCRLRAVAVANAKKKAELEASRVGPGWRRVVTADGGNAPLVKGDVLECETAIATVTRVSKDGHWVDVRAVDSGRSWPERVRLPLRESFSRRTLEHV